MTTDSLPPGDPAGEPFDLYPPEPETHLRDHLYTLLKRRWLIAAIAITVGSITAVRAFLQTPLYTSSAVVQITRGRLNVVAEVMVKDTWIREFYPTQQRVLGSRTLAGRVVDRLQLWQHPLFRSNDAAQPSPEAREGLAGAVQSMLSTTQLRDTQLIDVTFTTPDPELSAQLANTLVRQFMVFSSETQTDLARNTATFIREQIEKLQQDIQKKEQLLQDYSRRDDIVMIDQKENMTIQKLAALNNQLTQVQGERVAAEARYQSLRAANPDTLPEVKNNPSMKNLLNQRSSVQKQVAELSAQFKPEWPELQRTQRALEELNQQIEEESGTVAQEVVAAAQLQYQSALKRENLLRKEVEGQKRQAQGLNTLTTDYNRIQAELDNQRIMLRQLLRRHSETGLSADMGERQSVNVRVVEQAVVPKRSSSPNVRRSVLYGALLGLALAIGVAFFLDYWDTSIHTIEDLRRHITLPYLGMVPRYESDNTRLLEGKLNPLLLPAGSSSRKDLTRTRLSLALTKTAKATSNVDWSVISERFKFLRGSLLLSNPGAPPKIVLVTGPDKNAGKTFVVCNLAVSLAELNKKVLIIDADLRNPQIHRIFRYRNSLGLSSVLTGQAGLDKGTVYTTPLPNIFVMLAGPACPSPAELLGSNQMEEILALCAERFDYVLLDSAPLIPVFDSHVLTARCDACLLVVRSGHTSRYAVQTSLDFVDRVGGRVTGVVLNDVNLTDRAQNYYYTNHTYEYGTYASTASKENRA